MLRILYVDDNSQYRWMVSEAIKKKLGINIELASSGNEAIGLLSQGHRYSVIISDYSMPDGNGADLYRHIVENKIFNLFILFTSHDDDARIRSQFVGKIFLGIVSKANLRELCAVLVTGLMSWRG